MELEYKRLWKHMQREFGEWKSIMKDYEKTIAGKLAK